MTIRYVAFEVAVYSEGPQRYRFRRTGHPSFVEARDLERDVTAWCNEQFGFPSKRGRWRYRDSWNEVHLRDPADAFAFKMRWS